MNHVLEPKFLHWTVLCKVDNVLKGKGQKEHVSHTAVEITHSAGLKKERKTNLEQSSLMLWLLNAISLQFTLFYSWLWGKGLAEPLSIE